MKLVLETIGLIVTVGLLTYSVSAQTHMANVDGVYLVGYVGGVLIGVYSFWLAGEFCRRVWNVLRRADPTVRRV